MGPDDRSAKSREHIGHFHLQRFPTDLRKHLVMRARSEGKPTGDLVVELIRAGMTGTAPLNGHAPSFERLKHVVHLGLKIGDRLNDGPDKPAAVAAATAALLELEIGGPRHSR